MSLLPDLETFDRDGQPGDWCFTTSQSEKPYIAVRLTAAQDGVAIIPIRPPDAAPEPGRGEWEWDGNREAPTLSPSILHHSEPKWHGYLRAGRLEIV